MPRCGPPGTLRTAQPVYRSLALLSREMDYRLHWHHHRKFYWTALTWNEDRGELVSQREIKTLGPREGWMDAREAKLTPTVSHSYFESYR